MLCLNLIHAKHFFLAFLYVGIKVIIRLVMVFFLNLRFNNFLAICPLQLSQYFSLLLSLKLQKMKKQELNYIQKLEIKGLWDLYV